jgi:hypothetical protein
MASDTGGEAGQGAGRPLGGTAAQEAEIARLRAQVAALQKPRHRLRSFFAAVFIVLAWILAPLSVVAAWTSSIVGDTNRYVHTVAPWPGTRTSRPRSPAACPRRSRRTWISGR